MQCVVKSCVETVFQQKYGKKEPFCEALLCCINSICSFASIDSNYNWEDFAFSFCQFVKNYVDVTFDLFVK